MGALRRSALALTLLGLGVAAGDPCGMVPPVYTGDGPPIARIGLQKTYVCYRDGIESFVIRPGYRGKVEHFGMLIPFPTPPAIRKVADDVFPHLAAAIDPPGVALYDPRRYRMSAGAVPAPAEKERGLGVNQVRVLREEAIGMYEVAVLEAGSAAALQRWMSDHGYQYPDGMDATCEDYVAQGWCFVAVKTRVGRKAALDPKPGMREGEADPSLPEGAGFDGHVQAMGFRFRTDELVVPMRLSAFNEGELRNVIYLLAPEPMKIDFLPESFVKRQIPGAELLRNISEPLPVYLPGRYAQQGENLKRALLQLKREWPALAARRGQRDKNGLARDLFAADLFAIGNGRLANPFEEEEKALLNVAERLGLRGSDLDALHREVLAKRVEEAADRALATLKDMTLTVIDGDFPRDLLAEKNLTFTAWTMPAAQNDRGDYECTRAGPNPSWDQQHWFRGETTPEPIQPLPAGLSLEDLEPDDPQPPRRQGLSGPLGWICLMLLLGGLAWRRRS